MHPTGFSNRDAKKLGAKMTLGAKKGDSRESGQLLLLKILIYGFHLCSGVKNQTHLQYKWLRSLTFACTPGLW